MLWELVAECISDFFARFSSETISSSVAQNIRYGFEVPNDDVIGHVTRRENILDGTVIGRNMQHHRHQEFIRFLNTIEQQVPVGKVIHAIVDNYATHKHPKVRQWLARHPRWTFHFTPTSASWLNAVEGFFAKLTRQRLKRGVFRSVMDLQVAINRFVAETNLNPKPFVWTADPKRVLAAVKRGKQTLESVH